MWSKKRRLKEKSDERKDRDKEGMRERKRTIETGRKKERERGR